MLRFPCSMGCAKKRLLGFLVSPACLNWSVGSRPSMCSRPDLTSPTKEHTEKKRNLKGLFREENYNLRRIRWKTKIMRWSTTKALTKCPGVDVMSFVWETSVSSIEYAGIQLYTRHVVNSFIYF